MKWYHAPLLGITIFLASASTICLCGLFDHVGHADVGIVLGNTVNLDGQPSDRLQARLRKTAELYEKGYFPFIIVSGGMGKEGFDEAAVMRGVLIHDGVPAQNILLDPEGKTTYLTAKNSARIMQERGMKSAFIVSQYSHLPRARLAFHHFGVLPLYYAHANYFELRDVYSAAREVFGIAFYAWRDI